MSESLVGRGLLRILADTIVMTYKLRHIRWRADGSLGSRLDKVLDDNHNRSDKALDQLAMRIHALGVLVPSDLAALASMSSVDFDPEGTSLIEAVSHLIEDHKKSMDDIRVLQATLDADAASTELMESIYACHEASGLEMRRIFGEDLGLH